MATIHKEVIIDAPTDKVWAAIADVGALHTRLVPGFVIDTVLKDDVRTVTFGNGMTAEETIITIDHAERRFVYSVSGGRLTQHSASNQVFAAGEGRCRFVWIADVLPHAAADTMGPMMAQGAQVLKATMEAPA
ncbi:MAG: SRPBCC family protein [Phenylobacterium sp.]|uniref:SRPBCC family protein n=1 Tax=Phenylobacterium sp. TaxID=1871053 RepID=UPI003BB7BAF2